MTIDFIKEHDALIMQISGEIDHRYASEIREKADAMIAKELKSSFIIDMTNVNFMDSSGIGMILGRYKLVKSYMADFMIVSNNMAVGKILDMSGILKIIPVYPDLSIAINTVRNAKEE